MRSPGTPGTAQAVTRRAPWDGGSRAYSAFSRWW